jgi:hypothetical protein
VIRVEDRVGRRQDRRRRGLHEDVAAGENRQRKGVTGVRINRELEQCIERKVLVPFLRCDLKNGTRHSYWEPWRGLVVEPSTAAVV